MKPGYSIHTKPPSDFLPTMHVVSCYITCQGRLLLLKSSPHKKYGGTHGAPGGKLEPLETPLTGAIRETYEETGLLLDSREVQHHTTFYIRYPGLDFVYHVFVLALPAPPPQIKLSPREHVSFIWAKPEEMAELSFIPASFECFQYVFGEELNF